MVNKYKYYDELGVRCFIKPATSGGFTPYLYRKPTQKEIDKKVKVTLFGMIPETHIQSYITREEAETVVFDMAKNTLKLYKQK